MVSSKLIMSQLLLLAAASGEADTGTPADALQCDPAGDPASCGAVDGDVLLQKGSARSRAHEHIGVDDASGRTEPPGTVNWNGWESFTLGREEFHGGFPAEIYYKIPRGQLGDMNASHVLIPFDTVIKGIFMRHMHDIGSYEFGMVTWNWSPNPISMVGKNVSVGAGEKLHTFVHGGFWGNESQEQAREIQEGRWSAEDVLAGASRVTRHAAVNTYILLTSLGGQLANASIDPNVFHDVEEAALAPSSAFDQRVEAMAANLTQQHASYVSGLNGAWPTPTGTTLDCYHFTGVPDLQITPGGVWVPLGKKIPSVQGQINLAPLQRFGFMYGNSFIKYDADEQAFGFYMGVAGHSEVVDPYLNSGALHQGAKLFVGPADGSDRPIAPEGRYQPPHLSAAHAALVWSLHQAFYQVPADFNFLWAPAQEQCPPAEYEQVKSDIKNLDLGPLITGTATTADKLYAVSVMTAGIACSTEYLRADIPNSHSYGLMAAMTYLHAVLEFGFSVMGRGWNTISEDLFCPDSGCHATTPTTTTTEADEGFWDFWR